MPHRAPARRTTALIALTLSSVALAACASTEAASRNPDGSPTATPSTPQAQVALSTNVPRGATNVAVDKVVRVTATDGELREVSVRTAKGVPVKGALNADKTRWVASDRLESARKYVVKAIGVDKSGTTKQLTSRFATRTLTLKEQTYPSLSPLNGQTVGVGFPIMVRFDVPVTNRAAFEKNMKVTSSAGQGGSWYWIDGQSAHYRPKHYWKPGSTVKVDLNLKSVNAGKGIYGQMDRHITFKVGDAMVSKVNIRTDQMTVFRNGRLIRTIPITTGRQPEHTTRSGIKVIVEQFRHKRMNSETVGIDPNSADGYDLDDVEYAQRLTFSGEFIHAAPWSVASQGRANVSHGCTGMSTANAGWFYANSRPGDVVEYTGSTRYMTMTNGYGDWNLNWADWKKGSAL